MPQIFPFSATSKAIGVFSNGVFKSIPSTHPHFDRLREALLAPDHDEDLILELADLRIFLVRHTFGAVQIADSEVRWNGTKIHGVLVERILDHLKKGLGLDRLGNFLNRVMLNPLEAAREELYEWLEKGNAPITPDGFFLAFKNVRADYTDIHSGTFDNSVGKKPEMKRSDVDPDRRNECSRGLHFCSFGYLPSFSNAGSGGHTMILRIDPADVIAIPNDHNRQKGRTWIYEVIGELPQDKAATYYENRPAVDPVDPTDDEDDAERTATEAEIPFSLGQIVICVHAAYAGLTEGRAYEVQDCDDAVVILVDDDGDQVTHDVDLFREADDAETDAYVDAALADEQDGPEVEEPSSVKATAERQFYSKAARKTILESELRSLLAEHGQRGASRLTGVPRTTIQEWLKVLDGEVTAEG